MKNSHTVRPRRRNDSPLRRTALRPGLSSIIHIVGSYRYCRPQDYHNSELLCHYSCIIYKVPVLCDAGFRGVRVAHVKIRSGMFLLAGGLKSF